jgi:WD40 repeat protein
MVVFNHGGPAMIVLYDVATGKKVGEVSGTGGFINGFHNQVVRLSPDGKTLATANSSKPGFPQVGGIALWEAATGKLLTTFLGHRHDVIELAFSVDGKSLASRDYFVEFPEGRMVETSIVRVFDLGDSPLSPFGPGAGQTGPPIGLPLDPSAVTAMCPSPDGRVVAVGFANGLLHICDATSLKVLNIFGSVNKAAVNALKFSSDGKQLVLGRKGSEKDNNIEVWDPVNGKVLQAFPGYLKYEHHSPYEKWKRTLWFSDITDKLVIAPSRLPLTPSVIAVDYSLTLWDIAANKPRQVLPMEKFDEKLVALSPDAQILAISVFRDRKTAGSVPKCITLRDIATGKERDLPGDFYGFAGYTLQFSPDGKYLALPGYFQVGAPQLPSGETPAVRLYEVATAKELAFVAGHAHAAFSPDSKTVLTRSIDQIALWDTATGKEIGKLDDPERFVCDSALFSPDGKTVATLTLGKFERHPFRDGKRVTDGSDVEIKRMQPYSIGHSGSSPGGLQSLKPLYEVHIWDTATRQRRNRFIVSWEWFVDEMAFSSDGQTIYTRSQYTTNTVGIPEANHVQAWDVATGQLRGSVGDNGTRYHALAFAPDGKLFAVTEQLNGVRDRKLYDSQYTTRVWDVARRAEVAAPQTFTATELPVKLDATSLLSASNRRPDRDEWANQFTFGYRWVVETSADGRIEARDQSGGIELTELETGKVLHVLKGNEAVTRMAFSPDGKTLAVGTRAGQIRFWNVAAGRLLLTIQAHGGSVNGLAFRADGRLLASCTDNEIRYWRAGRE